MEDSKHTDRTRSAQFIYRGTIPPALGLLLFAPLLFLFLSFAAVALVGGAVAAFVLPLLFRRRPSRSVQETNCITLERDQYSRVDPGSRRFPPR